MQQNCFYICRMKTFINSSVLDKLGMTASIGCAIHCAALPFLITILPLLGMEFLALPHIEVSMIVLSLVIAVWSLTSSYRAHKSLMPAILLALGFLLIFSGHLFFEHIEAALIPLGGLTIAVAHYYNWRLNRICKHI